MEARTLRGGLRRWLVVVVASALVVSAGVGVCVVVWGPPSAPGGVGGLFDFGAGERTQREAAEAWLDGALEVLARERSVGSIKASDIGVEAAVVQRAEGSALGLYDVELVEGLRAGYGPLFVDGGGLTPLGMAAWQAVRGVESHGLDPSAFQVRALAEELERLDYDVVRPVDLGLSEEARLGLVAQLARLELPPSPQEVARRLVTPGSSMFEPSLGQAAERLQEIRRRRLERLGRIEVLMTDAVARYGAEMEAARWCGSGVRLPWSLADRRRVVRAWGRLGGEGAARVCVQVRVEAWYEELARQRGSALAATRLLGMAGPRSAEYDALRVAHRELRERSAGVEASEGLPFIEWTFRVGEQGEAVAAMRARLVEEELLAGVDGPWDVAADQAVVKARRRYGLADEGGVDVALVQALNVPVEARLRQMALNLQRWRRLPLEAAQTYVLLNVATGRGVVVRSGRRLLAFEVRSADAMARLDAPASFFVDALRFEGGARGGVVLETASGWSLTLSGAERTRRGCRACLTVDQPLDVARRLLQLVGRGDIDVDRAAAARARVPLNPFVPLHVAALTTTVETDGEVIFSEEPEIRP